MKLASIDMSELYHSIACYCISKDILCPNIIVVNDMQTNVARSINEKTGAIDVIALNSSLTTDQMISHALYALDKKCTVDGFKIMDMGSVLNDLSSPYLIAVELAKSLNIQCPQIIIADSFDNMALNTDDLKMTSAILLRCKKDFGELIKCLAHEMRHAWQHAKHAKKYFQNYDYALQYTDLERYLMQQAEIDADAYAYRVLNDVFGVMWHANRCFDTVNKAVDERSRKMAVSFSDGLKRIGR